MMPPPVKEPLAGLALLVIFGLLIWYDRPGQSSRPFDPYTQQQDSLIRGDVYESWLWQDAFGFKPDEKENPKLPCQCRLSAKIHHIKNEEKKDVKILAPLLKVRPDAMDIENKELRTRQHYAVIAGLIESGYRPSEPDHLHFCSSKKSSSNKGSNQKSSSQKEYDVRWGHYRRPDKPDIPDIIVVWMNSEIFTDDGKFDQMSESLFKSKEISKIDFSIYDLDNILDQKRSAEITEKINRINDKNCKNKGIELKGIQTDDEALIKKLTKELELRNIKKLSDVMVITEQDSENARSLANNFCKSLSGSFVKDKEDTGAKDKTNADGKDISCEIRNVFYLKGLDAYQQKQDKNEDQANKAASRLSEISLSTLPPLPIGPGQFDYVHRLAEQIKSFRKEINLEKRDSGIKAVGVFGSDFYDKLLIFGALRAEMPNILIFTTDLDAQMLHPQHWLSTRNLVAASHFNLLLEDSEKDNKEYQKQSSQQELAPFRDSQQTTIFFRTLEIVANDIATPENDITTPKIPPPQIFEVGRNGFRRLAQEENENLNNPPHDAVLNQAILPLVFLDQTLPQLFSLVRNFVLSLDQTKLKLLQLAVIMFSLILFYSAIIPGSAGLTGLLFLGTLLIFAIPWLASTDELGEPLSFTEGISLWLTLFIQIIAIIMAFAFFLRARKELEDNFNFLSQQYYQQRFRFLPRDLKFVERTRLILRFIIFIILIFSIAVYALNDVNPSDFPIIECLGYLMILALAHVISKFLYKHKFILWHRKYNVNIDFSSIKHWMEKGNGQLKDEIDLWVEYHDYGPACSSRKPYCYHVVVLCNH